MSDQTEHKERFDDDDDVEGHVLDQTEQTEEADVEGHVFEKAEQVDQAE